MDARDFITVGMSAERLTTVTREQTVQHFVPHMPAVFGTPLMIMAMEITSGDAIAKALPQGWVTVGSEVDIRHLAPAFVGQVVRTTAVVTAVERRIIRFEVSALLGDRVVGDGRHARGLVNLEQFNKRFAEG
jgi:fluoroacetyl-CoA thioesterase